jgi:heptosyltransferase I
MGDVLHALPAVHLLRSAIPECEIGWAIERRWTPLLCANGFARSGPTAAERPLVNVIHEVDTRAWRKALLSSETQQSIVSAFSAMRAKKYDLALDFQGAIKSSLLAAFSGAGSVLGFQEPREYVARMFYSETIATSMPHVVDQNFAMARDVAGDAQLAPRTLLPIDAAADTWIAERISALGIARFAILAPTAGWAAKEWPAANYGAVAEALAKCGIASLINFGPGEERVAEEVRAASNGAGIPLACDLSQLIALTRRASIFIGGDTGPMHLAAALNVPVVALFGPTDPARNGPYTTRARILRSAQSVTSYSHVSGRDEALAKVSVEEVVAAAMDLLA